MSIINKSEYQQSTNTYKTDEVNDLQLYNYKLDEFDIDEISESNIIIFDNIDNLKDNKHECPSERDLLDKFANIVKNNNDMENYILTISQLYSNNDNNNNDINNNSNIIRSNYYKSNPCFLRELELLENQLNTINYRSN
mgnify:CR=1 FL=1